MPQNPLILAACSAIQDFLASSHRNEHLYSDPFTLYLRKGVHAATLEGTLRLYHTLDVATIEVAPERQQQGLGTALLAAIHDLNPVEATYVEQAGCRPASKNWHPASSSSRANKASTLDYSLTV